MAQAAIGVIGPASAGMGAQRANELELLLMKAEVSARVACCSLCRLQPTFIEASGGA